MHAYEWDALIPVASEGMGQRGGGVPLPGLYVRSNGKYTGT